MPDEKSVPYPLFELYGPPCPVEGCKGVLTQCMSFKTKKWFKQCNICQGEFEHTPASEGELGVFERALKAQGITVPRDGT